MKMANGLQILLNIDLKMGWWVGYYWLYCQPKSKFWYFRTSDFRFGLWDWQFPLITFLGCQSNQSDTIDWDFNHEYLQVINKNNDGYFSDHDCQVFEKYLQFCGLGLRNAQIYERSQLEVKRNQVLLDLAGVIFQEQSTLEIMINRILTHILSFIQCERAMVLLGTVWKLIDLLEYFLCVFHNFEAFPFVVNIYLHNTHLASVTDILATAMSSV